MPGRPAKKSSKRASTATSAAAGRESGQAADVLERLRELEALNARLQAELAAARARITELEAARDQAIDRIAWVIDSLHNLTEK